jgi:hypothetical protein
MSNERFVICLNDFPVEVMTNESTEEDARQRVIDKAAEYERSNVHGSRGHHAYFHYHEVPLIAPGEPV